MCIYKFGHDRRWQTLYHATVEHFRSGRDFDFQVRQQIFNNGEEIPNTQLLRRVASTFKVFWGIPAAHKDNNWAATQLLQALNATADQGWADTDLVGKVQICIGLAGHAKDQQWTNGLHLSGITKYMWFLRPSGWTMCDSFARRGLCVGGDGPTAFAEFYQELQYRGFLAASENITASIQAVDHDNDWLYGERVIDKYLMIAGGAVDADLIPSVQQAINQLDGDEAESAHAIAQAVANQHCDDPFFLPPQD